jgi:ADP-ribosylglycohydrolase
MEREQKLKGMLFGSLAADSLSLGSHWVYNVKAIEKRLGRPDRLTDPIVKSFHPNRKKGEFTHYGDQALFLLEWIAKRGDYDDREYFKAWKDFIASYDGYLDHATKDTMEHGTASNMDDIAGASRTAVLALVYPDDREKLVTRAVSHALLTHNDPLVADTARFFSLLLFEEEGTMKESVEKVLSFGGWNSDLLEKQVRTGLDSAGEDTTETIEKFGQMCTAKRALSSTIHLLVTYENDVKEALVANTAAGGDSAARGMLVGMILGSRLGFDAVDPEWITDLVYKERIEHAFERIYQNL